MNNKSQDGVTQLNISDRINLLINAQNLTIKDFADHCDIPYRSMYNYLRNERVPSLEALAKISQTFNVNLNWLLLGEGEIEKTLPIQELSVTEKVLISSYRQMPNDVKRAIEVLFQAILKTSN